MYVSLEKGVSPIEIELSVFVQAHLVVDFAFLGISLIDQSNILTNP